MSRSTVQRLGRFQGRTYFLAVDVKTDWSNVHSFVATVFYRGFDAVTGEEQKTEIARIDNRSHGFTHFDRLFEEDQPMERFEGGVWDAWTVLENSWRKYAGRYERNHG